MKSDNGIIIVTGSNGIVGDAVMRRFSRSFEVVGFDRKAPGPPPPGCVYVPVEITSDESVREMLRVIRDHHGAHVASVIHLAAYYDFTGQPSAKYDEITVRGTERVLRGLKEIGFRVEQFVFSSTMLVHKPAEPGQFITEEWPLAPSWPYPESKVRTEHLILQEHGDLPVVLLRIAGVYDDLCRSIPLAHQIQRIFERQLAGRLYSGESAHGQSFLHMDDLVDAIELIVRHRASLPRELPLLLGEPETLSYDELQHTIARLVHGESWETHEVPASLAKAGAWLQNKLPGEKPFIKPWMIERANDHYALDITRARTLLGWEPKRSLRQTLPKMIEALKKDPAQWYRKNKLTLPAGEHGGMTGMTLEMRRQWLWTNFTVAGLGLWLISSPFTFGYTEPLMIWSDFVSGILLVFFALLAVSPRFDTLGRWSVSFIGIWLQFAPILFWAETPVAFVNDTLIGALVIAFSILIPSMPGMAHHMEMAKPGPEIPPGWSYNPSTWHQRAPMIIAAFAGWLLSRYLAAFQLGYIQTIWEPFFGEGTVKVLTSEVSRAFPISDAGLGAAAYTFEVLMACMGGVTRWRTMPWMVTFFFILIVPLGVTSIVLVMLQPVAVGYWCTICLATALIMLVMIPFTVDEVVAMAQFLKASRRQGKSLWRTFWVGGTIEEEVNEDTRTPKYGEPLARLAPAAAWGVTWPWTLLISTALGIWLMAATVLFGTADRAADSNFIVGAFITTVSFTAMAEVVRAARFLNMLFGTWIIAAPWLLAGAGAGARWHDLVAGALLILLSIPRGPVKERYAAWDRMIV